MAIVLGLGMNGDSGFCPGNWYLVKILGKAMQYHKFVMVERSTSWALA